MKTKQQILEEFKKEIDEVSSKYWEKLQATVEPEQPTSTRLERLGFYDKDGDYYSLDTNNKFCSFNELNGHLIEELIVGNSFKTEQDLQRAAKNREIMADLWRNSTPYSWRETCSIIYDHDIGEFVHQFEHKYQRLCPYFTYDAAKEMIAKHGNDLKLLLI